MRYYLNCLTIFQKNMQLALYTKGIKTIEEFLILVTQSENITCSENTQHNYQPHGNQNYNYNHGSNNYKPTMQHMQNRSAVNIAHKPMTQRVECSHQERESDQRDRERRGEKGSYDWPTSKKKFPCLLYTSRCV